MVCPACSARRPQCFDVGCGDGLHLRCSSIPAARISPSVASMCCSREPHFTSRSKCSMDRTSPSPIKSFDVVLFSDVLHHTPDPAALFTRSTVEWARPLPAHQRITNRNGPGGRCAPALYGLGRSNARFRRRSAYNYWTERQWRESLERNWTSIPILLMTAMSV